MEPPAVILDTNVFVAAAFNRNCASACILDHVRSGQLRMIWNIHTQRETRHILEKIPRLSWNDVADLFRPEDCHQGNVSPENFPFITDPDDRKYAALAEASGAVLVTNDDDLLRHRQFVTFEILKPGEYWQRHQQA